MDSLANYSTDFADLLRHSPHPYLRVVAKPDFLEGWLGPDESVAAHFRTDAGAPWILLLGQAARVLGDELLPISAPRLFTLDSRWTVPRLAEDLLGRERSQWDWWAIDGHPSSDPMAAEVVDLATEHDDEIRELLAVASPTASSPPGDPQICTWHGVRSEGRLVAVGAAIRWKSGAPVLASIATHPEYRGKGLARAVTSSLTRYFRAQGEGRITLGMYAANESARRTYTAVGYRVIQEFTSGSLN